MRSAAKSSLSFRALSLSCLTSNVTALNPPLLSDATCPNASVATLGENCAPLENNGDGLLVFLDGFYCSCVFRFSVFISKFVGLQYFFPS